MRRKSSRRAVVALIVLGSAVLPGCRREAGPAEEPAPPAASVAAPPAPASSAGFAHLPAHRGIVILSAEAPRLLPCGGGPAIPVKDDTSGALAEAYETLASAESGELWVQVRGEVGPNGLRVAAVERASPVGEGDPCASVPGPGEFRALGNEPFWAIEVTAAGIAFSEPGQEPVIFPLVEPTRDGERLTWVTERADPAGAAPARSLRLVLGPARCRDAMSGAWHPLAAEAVVDGRALAGCAYRGD